MLYVSFAYFMTCMQSYVGHTAVCLHYCKTPLRIGNRDTDEWAPTWCRCQSAWSSVQDVLRCILPRYGLAMLADLGC